MGGCAGKRERGVTEGGTAGSAAVRSGINFVCFEESVTDGAAVRIGATAGAICE